MTLTFLLVEQFRTLIYWAI